MWNGQVCGGDEQIVLYDEISRLQTPDIDGGGFFGKSTMATFAKMDPIRTQVPVCNVTVINERPSLLTSEFLE